MWELFQRAAPFLLDALGVTIFLGVTPFAIGSIIGLAVALARWSGVRPLTIIALTYLSIFRGTPMLVQLLLIYCGLPQIGISLDPIPSAMVALSLNVGSSQLSHSSRSRKRPAEAEPVLRLRSDVPRALSSRNMRSRSRSQSLSIRSCTLRQ